ncbi:MAG TPA: SRPBCC family protein [Kofleriaceae bacterium]|nr:SRPBCC family protein [Kofleriaceae bacterium]
MSETDRIEKRVLLRAPLAKVWHAIADAEQFGSWFGVAFDAPFEPGAHRRGTLRPTTADPEVARRQQSYAGMTMDITIERVEPMRLLSYRWHPFAIDPEHDYSAEPTTLVTFELSEAPGGTLLVITETGFDKVPLARRAKAFEANTGGWTIQAAVLEKYLAR